MAIDELQIKIEAINAASADLRKVTSDIKALERQTGSIAGSTTKASRSMSGFGASVASMAAGFITAQVAMHGFESTLKGTVGAAIDFESSFAGIKKTVDATDAEFKQLEQTNRDLAKSLPVSVNEINRIGEAAGALGITGVDNIANFEKTVAGLSVTTNLTADQAATAFGKIRTALGIPVDDLDNLASAIVDLGNKGASTEAEIVDFLERIAGAGKLLGITAPELAGISSAFASLGLEAEAGGTAIQRVFLSMQQAAALGGDELAVFAATTGNTVEGFKDLLKNNPTEAFIQFVEGLGGAGDQAIQILDALGLADARLERAFLTAAGAGSELRRQVDVGTTAYTQNTAAQAELEKRLQTTSSQWQLLKNNVNDVGISLGDAVLPALNNLLTALNASFEPLANAGAAIKDFVGAVREAAGPVDDIIIFFGTLGNPLNLLVLDFQALAGAMVPVINVALQVGTAIVNAVGGILNAGAQLVGGWSNIWGKVQSILEAVAGTIESILNGIGSAIASLGGFIDEFIGKLNGVTGAVGGLLGKAGIDIPTNIPTLGLTAPQISIGGGGGGSGPGVFGGIADIMSNLETAFGGVGDAASKTTPDMQALNDILANMAGGGGGGGGGGTIKAVNADLAALNAAFQSSGMSAEEFTARLELAQEAGELEAKTAEDAFRARVDLQKLAITLENAGISTLEFFESLVRNTLPQLGEEMVRVIAQAVQAAGAASAEEIEAIAKQLAASVARGVELSARRMGANAISLLNFDVIPSNGPGTGLRTSIGGTLTDAGLKKITLGLVELAKAANGAVPDVDDLLGSIIHLADVGKEINSLNDFAGIDPTQDIAKWEAEFRAFYQQIVDEFGVAVAEQIGQDFDATAIKIAAFYKSIQATGDAAEANAEALRKLAEAFEKSGLTMEEFTSKLAFGDKGKMALALRIKSEDFKIDLGGADFGGVGSHRSGLNYVPYDNYPALLHEGEQVLTKSERNRRSSGTILINYGRISVQANRTDQLAKELAVNLR